MSLAFLFNVTKKSIIEINGKESNMGTIKLKMCLQHFEESDAYLQTNTFKGWPQILCENLFII